MARIGEHDAPDEIGCGWLAYMITYPDVRVFPELQESLGQYFVLWSNGDSDIMPYMHLETLDGWNHGASRLREKMAR